MDNLVPAMLDVLDVFPLRLDVPEVPQKVEECPGALCDGLRVLFE